MYINILYFSFSRHSQRVLSCTWVWTSNDMKLTYDGVCHQPVHAVTVWSERLGPDISANHSVPLWWDQRMSRSRQPITAALWYHGISLANVVTYIKCELTSASRKLFKMPKKPHMTRCKCNMCNSHFESCNCPSFYLCNQGDRCTECEARVGSALRSAAPVPSDADDIVPVPSDADDNPDSSSDFSAILSKSAVDYCISQSEVPPDASLLSSRPSSPAACASDVEQGELFNEK